MLFYMSSTKRIPCIAILTRFLIVLVKCNISAKMATIVGDVDNIGLLDHLVLSTKGRQTRWVYEFSRTSVG